MKARPARRLQALAQGPGWKTALALVRTLAPKKNRPVRGGKLFPRHEENCLVSAMRDLSQCVNLAGHALPAPPVPRHVKTPLPNAAPGSAGSILGGNVFAAILAIGDGLA